MSQLVKWPGSNIHEDESHRLVTDEQIAKWDSGVPKIEIKTYTDMNDYTTTGFLYTTEANIGSHSVLENSPITKNFDCTLLGGFVIAASRSDEDVQIVTQVLYDAYLNQYMRNGYNKDGWVWGDWNKITYSNISIASKIVSVTESGIPPAA